MDGFTTGKAGGTTQPIANVPTAYAGDALELARAQRLAQMLSSTEVPEGQMISGRFVAPSWTQHLAKLAQAGTGAYFADQAEKQQLELAKKIREGENVALADYLGQLKGTPASEGKPAVAGNPLIANLTAAQNDMLPAWMRQHAMKEATKGPDWKEISQYNQKTGNTENYRYDANSTDPRSTMQFLGISKPAIGAAEAIRLRDEGLLGGGSPMGGAPAGNVPMGGGAPVVAPAGGNAVMTGAPANKTASTAKKDDVVGMFGYNPFEAPKPPPTLTTGPQVRKFYADQAQPLPAESQKTVRGAINYQKAVDDLQTEFQGYTDSDLLKPSVRARLQQKVTNAYLLGKEANTLGALTGPDMGLLEKLVTDPTAFGTLILDRKTINSLYDAQRKSAGDTIRESYRMAQKAVPEDMRSNIIVSAKPIPMSPAEVKKEVVARGIAYDPRYEYRINPDGTVDSRKKTK